MVKNSRLAKLISFTLIFAISMLVAIACQTLFALLNADIVHQEIVTIAHRMLSMVCHFNCIVNKLTFF